MLERGASTTMWEAAALGLVDRVVAYFGSLSLPDPSDVTGSFWGACHGGHQPVAESLLQRGADLDWVGWDDLTRLDAAEREAQHVVVARLQGIGAQSAVDLG